jgi:hypothetical protein
VPRIEAASRDRIRPIIVEALDEVGLAPQNTPEQVAREKVVEELLDRIVENSYLNIGDLRDALSKNDLKLPDVAMWDLLLGDRQLRADKKLDRSLDGVYRRGPFYLRWSQTISSLAFGTNFGRFLTQYVAMPFGGAYLALEFIRHLALWISGKGHDPHLHEALADDTVAHEAAKSAAHAGPSWMFYAAVLLLGTYVLLLIHRPAFRAWTLATLSNLWRLTRQVFYEWPAQLLHSEIVQVILHSQTYAAIKSYVLQPAAVTGFVWLWLWMLGFPWNNARAANIFLLAALVLNSPVGRFATEVTSDFLVRLWHELRMRVFAAMFHWVMDVFNNLLSALDWAVYTVDEWLRFRAGDNRAVQSVKLVGGVAWFFVAYVIVFVFTLLVEPQINPIKHFPVVTVAHKLILPTGPVFVKKLTPYIGRAEANTLVWTTIWLVPGVFGFLVWELKENWRLYAANRSPTLRPVPIGHHGETMVRLLRPGFHSGTLPKVFAALRRASRRTAGMLEARRLTKKRTALLHVAEGVHRFVEREFVHLIEDADILPAVPVKVGEVRVATNRIDVELLRTDRPQDAALLTWEEDSGKLRGAVSRLGWLEALTPQQHKLFTEALRGLFQKAGVEEAAGKISAPITPAITWDEWVATWPMLPIWPQQKRVSKAG